MSGLTQSQARRYRKRVTLSKDRLIAAELMPQGTTLRGLPSGFRDRSPPDCLEKSERPGTPQGGISSSRSSSISVRSACSDSSQNQSLSSLDDINTYLIEGVPCDADYRRDALITTLSQLLEQAMIINANLKQQIKEKDFCLTTLLTNAPPSLSCSRPVTTEKVDLKDEGFEDDHDISATNLTVPPGSHLGWCVAEMEYSNAYLTHCYMPPIYVTKELVVLPHNNRFLKGFRSMVNTIRSLDKKNKPVTLGMWHNHWQKKPYGTGNHVNRVSEIPSITHPNLRWKVSSPLAGGDWTLEAVPTQHPEMGGISNSDTYGYGPDETRPPKKLEVAEFMDVAGLPYVDFELYIKLKRYTMENGTVASTHGKLHRLATTFMASYRTDHLAPELLLEIQHWTVLASMIPSQSEMRGLKMMANAELYKQMYVAARFKRDGKVKEKRTLWDTIMGQPPRLLEMYKPAPV